jgi:large subunit ribosomal protein L7/L12
MAEETEVNEETKAEDKAEAKEEKKEVPKKFKDLVEQVEKLSVLELSELVKVLEDHFGVSAAAPMAMAAAPAASGEAGAEAAEEKSAYTIVLSAAGDQKINVIKAVREITGLGLAESKALVDGAPKPIKENVPKAEADEAKTALEAAGATVELK